MGQAACRYSAPGRARAREEDERHRKRIDQAARRSPRAIGALAAVQRIQRPAVPLNVGERQVIMAR